jgi:putative transposase
MDQFIYLTCPFRQLRRDKSHLYKIPKTHNMALFNNKYRIEPARLQLWDYANDGVYFITICTKNRECYFGNIVDARFIVSEMGQLAHDIWMRIPNHFPFITLDAFVVMPNHVHGILILKNDDAPVLPIASSQQQPSGGITGHSNPMAKDNISEVIRWYKGRCSFGIRKIHAAFVWQSRFHNHIIRDGKSFDVIRNYILTNPEKWNDDRFNINRG